MFEEPWALLLLLLALPWWWWGRRRRPRPWVVGGLEPFRGLAAGAGGRRRTPPSTWLGLVALGCASLALAGPRAAPPPLGVVDASLSCSGQLPEGREPVDYLPAWARAGSVVVLGDPETPVAEAELLACLRQNGAGGRRVAVVSDRPEPLGLPAGLRWIRPSLREEGATAAILAVWPEASGQLAVHWVSWGLDPPLRLRLEAAGQPPREEVLEGREGVVHLTGARGPGRFLLLHPELPAPEDGARWRSWRLPRPAQVRLPATAAAEWEAALAALLPGVRTLRGGAPGAADLVLAFRPGVGPGVLSLAGDPFRELPPRRAMAAVAAALEPWRRAWWGMPRLRFECAPDLRPRDWRRKAWSDSAPGGGRNLAAGLAAAGLLLYLLSLHLRRRGR